MFNQKITRQFREIWQDILEGIQDKTKKLMKHSSRISALTVASKFMTFALVFSFLPMGNNPQVNLPKHDYDTKITFNQNDPFILSIPEAKTEIEPGVSRFEIAQRPALANSTEVKYPDGHAHADPAVFRPIYMAAAKQFNIPWQLIEAVHQIESGKSGSTDKRSYAGATGPMQFMPGTWRGYAVDGNGDGSADITDVTDAIYTGAHYLAKSGADEGRIDDAIFNYNHSQSYVNKVKGIAYEIGLPKTN